MAIARSDRPALDRGIRSVLPVLVPILGVILSLLAGWAIWASATAAQQRAIDNIAERAALAVNSKMTIQSALLRAAAGLFDKGDSVSPSEFSYFVDRLDLEETNPGTLGIAFTAAGNSEQGLSRNVTLSTGLPTAPVPRWPKGRLGQISQIVLISPMNDRNRAALGFDMLSEPTRAAAMRNARDTGRISLSGKVSLVQEIDSRKQPGMLLYLPLFRSWGPVETRFAGWIYSPLRAHDLFDTIFKAVDFSGIDVSIHDGEPIPANLLYGRQPASEAMLTQERRVVIAGRPLTITVQRPAQGGLSPALREALAVTIAGLLITALLTLLARNQNRWAALVERQVRIRTAELSAANERLRQEAELREEAEAQVRQMQKVEAVGQLTGGIAHDFNNMLAVILGNLDFAKRQSDLAGTQRYIERAETGAQRAAELTQRLLAFSRRQTLAPSALDINRLVREMSELLLRVIGEDVELETVLAGGLWTALADRSQLENSIVNLAVNARDSMPDGGKLTLETLNCWLDDDYVQANPETTRGQYVMIAVSDTGSGMSEEVRSKAFDPFFTTKDVGKGSGLGLSQVFGFVKQSNGHIKIYSEPGEGTTIKIYLPRYSGPLELGASEPAPATADAPRAKAGETILVVEDEQDVRALSVEVLRSLGYKVLEASGGEEALALAKSAGGISLVFTDVVMPRMNGRQLAERLTTLLPGVPVLFTTGYTPNAIVHHGKLDEGVELISKPFAIDLLARKVRAVIDRAQPPLKPGGSP